jgi:hypothetical protein
VKPLVCDLSFVATVCEDGSPKGTTYVLNDDQLLFADIRCAGAGPMG